MPGSIVGCVWQFDGSHPASVTSTNAKTREKRSGRSNNGYASEGMDIWKTASRQLSSHQFPASLSNVTPHWCKSWDLSLSQAMDFTYAPKIPSFVGSSLLSLDSPFPYMDN
ncbi:hypothetical protein JOM56_014652 [Amanita muscaria]